MVCHMKANVLVVEDSPAQRNRLVSTLQERGYEVRAAENGLAALREIKTAPPDVVILDVVLDGMDGYSVCRWLRLGETTRDIVVIMLTVKTDVKERVEGLHVGADDYVAKPYNDDELEARIFAAMRTRNARQELRARNAELESMLTKTERLAMTDALTGVFNRRRFTDVLRREWATSKRYNTPLSLLLIDVDRFKLVNDTDGHAAGDDVLRAIADLISASIREVDVAARYGGDEFAVLLPHTAPDKATVVADRMREKLTRVRGNLRGAAQQISLSIGIAGIEDPELTAAEDMLEAADRALYDAKRSGRDRTLVAKAGILGR
jgi:two-component system cell cycle response regulator